MGVFKDENDVMIGSSRVSVTGASGLVHATWTLAVDGSAVDSAAAAGTFTLQGELPDGSTVRAQIIQSLMGPTEVAVLHDDDEVARFKGFVA